MIPEPRSFGPQSPGTSITVSKCVECAVGIIKISSCLLARKFSKPLIDDARGPARKESGWEAGIRTPIGGFRVRSPTVRRPPSKGISIYVSALRLSTYPLYRVQLESHPGLLCLANTPPQVRSKGSLVELVSKGQNVRAIRRLGKTPSNKRFTLPISRHTSAER